MYTFHPYKGEGKGDVVKFLHRGKTDLSGFSLWKFDCY